MKKALLLIVIAAMVALSLTSCALSFSLPSDPDALVTKLEINGYDAEDIDEEDFGEFYSEFGLPIDGIAEIIVATPDGENDEIGYFIYCKSTSDAIKCKSAVDKYMKENEDFKAFLKNPVVKQSGRIVYFGCENTLNEFT